MLIVLRKLFYILIICFVFTMPFSFGDVQLNNFLIILIAINTILFLLFSKKERNMRLNGMLILFISVFIIHLIGMLRTDNWGQALFDLEKMVSILIFPMVLFYSPRLDFKEARTILLTFVIGCAFTALVSLIGATYLYLQHGDSSFYFYHKLSGIVDMHAAYLAMYYCLAIIILLNFRFNRFDFLIVRNEFLYYSTLALFIFSIFLLASRTHIVLLTFGSVGFFAFMVNQKYGAIKSIIGAIILSITFMGVVMLFPINRDRFKEAFNYGDEFDVGKRWGEQQIRLLI